MTEAKITQFTKQEWDKIVGNPYLYAEYELKFPSLTAVVRKRRDDWTAYLKDNPEKREVGDTDLQAVEKLLVSVQDG